MRINGSWCLLLISLFAYEVSSQCRIINDRYASVYISFERAGEFSLDGEMESGFVLRLKNNSNCAITIRTQSDAHIYPRPKGFIEDVPYAFRKGEHMEQKPTGDAFLVITIRRGDSILFGAQREHFDAPDGWIEVPFGYKWEEDRQKDGTFVSSNHNVQFSISWIPWFKPVGDPNKPDWEILPQEAKAGEVILSKRNELGILSNFAATPFELDGKRYASVEGFWQMMLYPEGPDDPRAKDKTVTWKFTREQVAQMTAFEAKSAGTLAEENMKKLGIDWCTYQGKRFPYRSATPGEHYRLILAAMRAKLEQNPEVRRILLATGDLILKPDHHGEQNPPPEWKYYEIWMQLRAELRKSALQN